MSREQNYLSRRVHRLTQALAEKDEEIARLKADLKWWREQHYAPGVLEIVEKQERRTGS